MSSGKSGRSIVKLRMWKWTIVSLIPMIILFILVELLKPNLNFGELPFTEINKALASIYSTLLGFIITAVAIVIALPQNKNFEPVIKHPRFKDIYVPFWSAMRWLASGSIYSLFIVFFNAKFIPLYLFYEACLYILINVSYRIFKVVWTLKLSILIHSNPSNFIKYYEDATKTTKSDSENSVN